MTSSDPNHHVDLHTNGTAAASWCGTEETNDPNFISGFLTTVCAIHQDKVRKLFGNLVMASQIQPGVTLDKIERENLYLNGILGEIDGARDKLALISSQIVDGVDEDRVIRLAVDEKSINDGTLSVAAARRVNNTLKKYNAIRDDVRAMEHQLSILRRGNHDKAINRLFRVGRRYSKEALVTLIKTFENLVGHDIADEEAANSAIYEFVHGGDLTKSSMRAASLVRLQSDETNTGADFNATLDTLRLITEGDNSDVAETDNIKKIIRQFVLCMHIYGWLRKNRRTETLELSPHVAMIKKYRTMRRQLKNSRLWQ